MRRLSLLALLALSILGPSGCSHFQKKKDKDDDNGTAFDPKFKQVGLGNQARMPANQRW